MFKDLMFQQSNRSSPDPDPSVADVTTEPVQVPPLQLPKPSGPTVRLPPVEAEEDLEERSLGLMSCGGANSRGKPWIMLFGFFVYLF